MSKLSHVTHSQHERTVDIIRCQTERRRTVYLAINLCLRLAISVSISIRPNQYRHSAITSIDVVRKTFMRTLFKVNSNDLSCVLFNGHASNAYSKHGIWILSTGELLPLSHSSVSDLSRNWSAKYDELDVARTSNPRHTLSLVDVRLCLQHVAAMQSVARFLHTRQSARLVHTGDASLVHLLQLSSNVEIDEI